jgi:hypothetical protein
MRSQDVTLRLSFWRLVLLAMLVNVVTQAAHEAGHWAVYEAYGRGPVWGFIGLVQLWDQTPRQPQGWLATAAQDGTPGWLRLRSAPGSPAEAVLAAAAGPAASLLACLAGLAAARYGPRPRSRQVGLLLALLGSVVMLLYYARSPLRSGGDEQDIAAALGIAPGAVEAPLALAFAACLALGLRRLGNWRTRLTWLAAVLLGSVPAGLLLQQADRLVRAGVEQGQPLFRPVLGFSLPVAAINGLALTALWLAWWSGGAAEGA